MRKLFTIVCLVFISNVYNAQETLPYYQQHLLDGGFLFNPAKYGETDEVKVNANYQKQFAKLDASPNVQSIGMHANVYDRLGVGLAAFRDQNGPISANGITLGASYFLPISDFGERENQFSFGTSVTAYNMSFDRAKLYYQDPGDIALEGDDFSSLFLIYANFGLAAKYKGLFGGASVTDIALTNDKPIVNNIEPAPIKIYLNAGYDWKMGEGFKLTPSAMAILNTNSSLIIDTNLMGTIIGETTAIAAGASFRMAQNRYDNQQLSISPMVKVNINKLMIGASYNIGLSDIQTFAGNSFMVSLGYNFDNFINLRGFRY